MTMQEKILGLVKGIAKKFSFDSVLSFHFPNVVTVYFIENGIPDDILCAFSLRLNFQPEYVNYSFQASTSKPNSNLTSKQADYLKDMSCLFRELEKWAEKYQDDMADFRKFNGLAA